MWPPNPPPPCPAASAAGASAKPRASAIADAAYLNLFISTLPSNLRDHPISRPLGPQRQRDYPDDTDARSEWSRSTSAAHAGALLTASGTVGVRYEAVPRAIAARLRITAPFLYCMLAGAAHTEGSGSIYLGAGCRGLQPEKPTDCAECQSSFVAQGCVPFRPKYR